MEGSRGIPSFRHSIIPLLSRDPWFLAGTNLAIVLTIAVLAGPFLAPYDPHDMSFPALSPSSPAHWLGVNDGGMDILSELLYGLRNTVGFGLLAGILALVLGVGLGLGAAWFGGLVDQVTMRTADILLAIPAVMILILMAAFFRLSPVTLALLLAFMYWPTTAKSIRAQALVVKSRLHIHAARQMGGSGVYIIGRHLLPELFPLYLIGFATKARMAMFMEASLSFLGLFDPSRKSLGMMISYALKYYYLDVWWNWLLPPILCLTLLIMAVTFLAVSLEKVFDPRLKEP
ncbi:MAG: ABC transporter permease [Deltaproteobacteria bacterium HGW-Deltaproteobacteria-21]|nr:MAG: ABC transporter permease [Deltaproteobacteria bacterium HGW-Deltaproteobacteria-21]